MAGGVLSINELTDTSPTLSYGYNFSIVLLLETLAPPLKQGIKPLMKTPVTAFTEFQLSTLSLSLIYLPLRLDGFECCKRGGVNKINKTISPYFLQALFKILFLNVQGVRKYEKGFLKG